MTMQQEQLLQPRYKVIADMPFKPSQHMYNIGDILTDNGKTAVLDQNGDPVFPCEWEKYPHIFRPLEWWEERQIEDMPEYVRHVNGSYYKIGKWKQSNSFGGIWFDETLVWLWSNVVYPTTEKEYNAYINSK